MKVMPVLAVLTIREPVMGPVFSPTRVTSGTVIGVGRLGHIRVDGNAGGVEDGLLKAAVKPVGVGVSEVTLKSVEGLDWTVVVTVGAGGRSVGCSGYPCHWRRCRRSTYGRSGREDGRGLRPCWSRRQYRARSRRRRKSCSWRRSNRSRQRWTRRSELWASLHRWQTAI